MQFIPSVPMTAVPTGTMKAIRFHDYGGPEVLALDTVPIPAVGADEVLVRMVGAGVNPADWKIRSGAFRERRPANFPETIGTDLSGVVAAAGALVTRFKIGDAVMGRVENAAADYVLCKSDHLASAPASIPLVHAGGVPVAAGVAWLVLFDVLKLRAGQSVLVHAASGGVGSFAVQMAKLAGARVLATASASNLDLVRGLGADEVIDYRSDDFVVRAGKVDTVFDTVGGETQARSWEVLRPGGVLASIVAPPSEELARKVGATGRFGRRELNGAVLGEISGLIDRGRLKVLVEALMPLAEAHRAHELSQGGHACGKIILTGDLEHGDAK